MESETKKNVPLTRKNVLGGMTELEERKVLHMTGQASQAEVFGRVNDILRSHNPAQATFSIV